MDKLIDGETKDLNSRDLLNIQLWIEDSIEKLNQLGYTVINRGDIVDDITNQINALNEIRNNLELVKLTKDGKIYNFKKIAEVFSERGVQKRTSVPKNERAPRRPAERVPGPATREELEILVKEARNENLGDLFQEPKESKVSSEAIEKIMSATLSNIEEVYETEFLKAVANNEDTTELTKAYDERLQELKTVISINTIEKGEYLISKNPIFDDQSQTIYQVVRINKQSVRVRNIVSQVENTINENELMDNFEKTTMEATQPEPETPITPMDVEDSKESKNTIKNLQNDPDALNNAKKQSQASDKQSRLNKVGTNSKLC
jgi:hypothetical protein